METRPRHYVEVSVIQDSTQNSTWTRKTLKWTRIRITRVTESGKFDYQLQFPGTILAIERSVRKDVYGLTHPEDEEIIRAEIARVTHEVHPDKTSEWRKDLRRKLFDAIDRIPRPKSKRFNSQNGNGEYWSIGLHEIGNN